MSHPWMPFYVADYLADTMHLSTVEHGAYLLLICHYWKHGKLPSNARALPQICKLSDVAWAEVEPTLSDLFEQPGWKHKRIDAELEKAEIKHSRRVEAGSRGGNARAKHAAPLKPLPSNAPSIAQASSSQPQSQEDIGARSAPAPPKRGTRLSADWTLSPENLSFAEAKGIPPAKIAVEAQKFRDHFIAKPGKDGVKLDWDATWRTWVAKACEWQGYAPVAGGGNVAELVWITTEDARWSDLEARYRRENAGRSPAALGGNGGMGRRWPKSWVDELLEIPAELRRSA